MFDPFLRAVAQGLAALYALPVLGGSYGGAIILLTLVVMVLLMPLTLKATRSTIKMTALQPELKRLQKKHKDDRETLNQEMMKLYTENGINPVGGCLPMLAQLPVFLILFQVLRGLTRRLSDSPFYEAANLALERQGIATAAGNEINPRYISEDTQLYQDLFGTTEMDFGPFDLAAEAWDVLQDSIFSGLPYVALILLVVGTSYYQQRQISARRTNDSSPSPINTQQQMLLRFLPLLSGFWSFLFPAGLVLYWATSNTFRIGQQAYITRQIYGKEAEAGKHALPLTTSDDDAKKDKGESKNSGNKNSGNKNSGNKNSGNKNSGNKNSGNKASGKNAGTKAGKDGAAKSNGTSSAKKGSSKSKSGGKDAEWKRLRAEKQAKQRSASTTSSRITPKGTQARPQQKKKRKR